MTQFLEEHFQNRLEELGYPDDLTVEFSLGHCQGDGMAFYGSIPESSLGPLMMRLLSPHADGLNAVDRVKNLLAQKHLDIMVDVIKTFGRCGLEIARNDFGHHYSHFNTMSLYDDSEPFDYIFSEGEDVEKLTGIEGLTHDVLPIWEEIWERFCQALEEDIPHTSRLLEAEGYKILEGMSSEEAVVWEFHTRNLVVRLLEQPCRDLYAMDGWDDEPKKDAIQGMLDGTQRVVSLEAEVRDRETDVVLGQDCVDGLLCDVDDKDYGGLRWELLKNAMDAARSQIQRLNVRAA